MGRCNKTQYQQRVHSVQSWIIEDVPGYLIIDKIVTNGWCEERQAYRLIQRARENWIKVPELEIEKRRRLKIEELKHLKRSLKEEYKGTPKGIAAVLKIEKEIITLEQLRPPQHHVVKGDPDAPLIVEVEESIDYSKLSDEALSEIMNAVLKKDDESKN